MGTQQEDPADFKPSWQEWPASWEAWPIYKIGEAEGRWRGGREAGAWIAGLVSSIPEKCARITVEKDWIAGAIMAMIEGGLAVSPYATNDTAGTYEVWSAVLTWGPERVNGFAYEPAGK